MKWSVYPEGWPPAQRFFVYGDPEEFPPGRALEIPDGTSQVILDPQVFVSQGEAWGIIKTVKGLLETEEG